MRYIGLGLLLSLLLAVQVQGGAAAQGPAVLAEGEPPLTSATVDDVAEFFGKLDPETYTFRFSNEAGGRRLCLTNSKGGEVCYRAE